MARDPKLCLDGQAVFLILNLTSSDTPNMIVKCMHAAGGTSLDC